ncbi:isomerase [Rhodobacterales bacterium 56_14_T64]|nr:isomerase [Rhodobacterales bacterium 56_14_T64]
MKIGMCMFLWTTNIGLEHEALLREIKDAGFDGVEIPVFEGRPSDYAEIGKMLDRIGLERTAVTAISDPHKNLISDNTDASSAGVDYMRWAIKCSHAMGANKLSGPLHSTLGHFSGEGPTRDEFMRSIDAQRRIGDCAEAFEVTICLEALNRFECYFLNTMAALSAHIREIDHPRIRAMYDTFHANIEEADPIAALTQNADLVEHIHISENDRGVPGRGNIPWDDTFAAIAQSGYDGWLTIESFGRGLPNLAAATKVWRDFAESPEAVYRDGYMHIRRGMVKAGLS